VCDGKSKPTSRDRIVGQCFIDKLDIAGEMAKSGTVCDWPKFSGGHYKVSDKTCVRK
jgi:endonuclease YncB( thermonuclease family)